MAHSLTLLDDEPPNRLEWSLSKMLPEAVVKPAKFKFKLHGQIWKYESSLCGDSVRIDLFCRSSCCESAIRVGITGDSGKELIVKEAKDRLYQVNKYSVNSLITLSELDSIQKSNKELRLFVDIKRHEDEETLIRKAEIRKLRSDYEEMFRSGEDSDVTIQVKRKKFSCHKSILKARSPVFAAMLKSDMKERATGVVTIKDSEPTVFQQFLLYLYTGSGEHLKWTNVTELYKLADKYAVENLRKICIRKINERLSMENFCHFFELSLQYTDTELSNVVEQFFVKKSKEIVECEMWLDLLNRKAIACNVLIKALTKRCIYSTKL